MTSLNNIIGMMLAPVFLGLTACDNILSNNQDLGSGYQLFRPDRENYSILIGEREIVGPTIVSYDFNDKLIVGLKLHVQDVECKHGPAKMVTNERSYFVLVKSTNELKTFLVKEEFLTWLDQIDASFSLDFRAFDRDWAFYNSLYSRPEPNYWLSCKKVDE